VKLVIPARQHLASYVAALESGWSPDNLRGGAAADEQLQRIKEDPAGFLESLDDPLAQDAPIELPDGSFVKRLPSNTRWIGDGEFAGSIGFRWQPCPPALPTTCPGHCSERRKRRSLPFAHDPTYVSPKERAFG